MNLSEPLSLSIKEGASDLHLSPGLFPILLIDGDLLRADLPIMRSGIVNKLIYEVRIDRQIAVVDPINKNRTYHILAIEDPIEYVHQSTRFLINQRQMHRDIKSFSQALRAALRENPDVIGVGKMRDLETICLALTAD
jgi:Tfp pilus assembly pilus retraction ATPase PilT